MIKKFKKHIFALSKNVSWLFQRNFVGALLLVRGTLSGNMTYNELDLGYGGNFNCTQIAYYYGVW